MTVLGRTGNDGGVVLEEAFAAIYEHLAVAHPLVASDAIVCFGSRDPEVPVRGAELFHAGLAPVVVTTGGVVLRDGRTEAAIFTEALVEHGVPLGRIVTDEASLHTGDNVELAMHELVRRGHNVRSIIAVTWPFAARRTVATWTLRHPEVAVRSAPARSSSDVPPITPGSLRWAVTQVERLAEYTERGLIAPEPLPAAILAALDEVRAAVRSLGPGRQPQP